MNDKLHDSVETRKPRLNHVTKARMVSAGMLAMITSVVACTDTTASRLGDPVKPSTRTEQEAPLSAQDIVKDTDKLDTRINGLLDDFSDLETMSPAQLQKRGLKQVGTTMNTDGSGGFYWAKEAESGRVWGFGRNETGGANVITSIKLVERASDDEGPSTITMYTPQTGEYSSQHGKLIAGEGAVRDPLDVSIVFDGSTTRSGVTNGTNASILPEAQAFIAAAAAVVTKAA